MTRPENTPSQEGVFSSYDFYLTAIQGLLQRSTYRGDGHYLFSNIVLVDNEGNTSPGYYRLSDYHACDSRLFEFRDPANPIGADPTEQQRLLAIGRTVLGIQLYDANNHLQPTTYTSCWPKDLRPSSTIGFLYFYPEEEWHHAPFEDQTLWPSDTPLVVRSTESELSEVLAQPSNDPHLAQIFQELQAG